MSIHVRNQGGTLERVAGFSDVDHVLNQTSSNPIANKTVYNALAQKIEKTVTDLVNYYDMSQVYNKTEIRDMIGAINTLTIEVVANLPTSDISTTTIYFVGPASGTSTYDEYIYFNGTWAKIGDTSIDLSGYVTSTNLTTILQSYYTKTAVDALLDSYYNKTDIDGLLDLKEDVLTFDNLPTQSSTNPVKSGGVFTALGNKQDKTLETPLTISGEEKTTVEGALDGLNKGLEQAEKGLLHKNDTVLSTDKVPYLIRKVKNTPEGFSGYIRDKLIGGTIVWNQMVPNGNFADISGWTSNRCTTAVANNTITLTSDGTQSFMEINRQQVNFPNGLIANHKYFMTYDFDTSNSVSTLKTRFSFHRSGAANFDQVFVNENTKGSNSHIFKPIYDYDTFQINFVGTSNLTTSDVATVKNAMCIDLTQMFGATIADYLYSLETATAGVGITKLQEWGFCTDNYYDYNVGELISSKPSTHKVIGKNLVSNGTNTNNGYIANKYLLADGVVGDSGDNYISEYFSIIGGETYAVSQKTAFLNSGSVCFYDRNKNFISGESYQLRTSFTITAPSNAVYCRSTVPYLASRAVQIEIGNTITDYEPYSGIEYPLANAELQGIFKLDANNNLYYDGDVYNSNGTINRKYGIVDLGSLTNWAKDTTAAGYRFKASYSKAKSAAGSGSIPNIICPKYIVATPNDTWNKTDSCISINNTETASILIVDSDYSDVASLKTALSGVYLVYELKTPTKESVSPFADPQSLEGATIEEYVDTRTIPIPSGHETQYMGPSSDEEFTLPSTPNNKGTYILSNTVSGDKEALSWMNLIPEKLEPIDLTTPRFEPAVNKTEFAEIRKIGNMVVVSFVGYTTISLTKSQTTLFKLPVNCYPKELFDSTAVIGTLSDSTDFNSFTFERSAPCNVSVAGNLNVIHNGIEAGKAIAGQITYFID